MFEIDVLQIIILTVSSIGLGICIHWIKSDLQKLQAEKKEKQRAYEFYEKVQYILTTEKTDKMALRRLECGAVSILGPPRDGNKCPYCGGYVIRIGYARKTR